MKKEEDIKWYDFLGGIVFLILIGCSIGSCLNDKHWRDDAEYHRHIEYYLDENRDARWRWRPIQP